MSFSTSLINYLIGLDTADILLPFICGVVSVGLFILSRIKKDIRDEGYAILERIRQSIMERKWDKDFTVTISGGVAEAEGDELTDLLRNVDRLLYSAKNKSKNMIEKKDVGQSNRHPIE